MHLETYTQWKWEGVQDHKHSFVIWTKQKPDEDIKLGGCTIPGMLRNWVT